VGGTSPRCPRAVGGGGGGRGFDARGSQRSSYAADLERQGAARANGGYRTPPHRLPRRVSVELEQFWRDAPYTDQSACEWLISRRIKAVGYDYPPDYCVRTMTFEPEKRLTREDNTTHQAFFPVGIAVIEYLTNLDRIGSQRCRFLALPLPLKEQTARPFAPWPSSNDRGKQKTSCGRTTGRGFRGQSLRFD